MNRLRGRKKAKDDSSSGPRPSMDNESSGPFKMFGKSKKAVDEGPKPNLDLTAALPPSDDFRTSLLMTGLSARFSMLREQDDPRSKIGKASDDSVLFPKRQSRMMDFGAPSLGLHDISEVESLKAPHFARVNSFQSSDDSASMSGSIMNRSKPTDGNNLFGGRQKIYKISGSGSKAGAMSGRALYDDDVAQSSFQKWRQTERTRQSFEEEGVNETLESEPQLDYNRRRETSSTTSSGPSVGRNSTAATSVTSSHPAASLKDWQTTSVLNSVGSSQGLERSVTRTRRLYEQGLTQDLHESQSSALSRIDTLSRQRPFGVRTPDLTPPIPSPTNATFSDRTMERRPIIGKQSAPNLRSFSPVVSVNSQMSTAAPSAKISVPEKKPLLETRSPPLSPPVSESEDHPILPIQPSDRGKATASGAFSRPAHQYDDQKFAQRQRQLQQGRETPTNQFHVDAEESAQSGRSRPPSASRLPEERRVTNQTIQEESRNPSFFDDSDDAADESSQISQPPIERPNDQEHPAFRKSALPTPLSLSSRSSKDPIVSPEKSNFLDVKTQDDPPEDSPTLGPASGLSGMVRQHMRNASEASSVYATTSEGQDEDMHPSANVNEHAGPGLPESHSNQWGLSEEDWNLEEDETNPSTPAPGQVQGSTAQGGQENDEFARHLADGARRVREKLTSYVDTDTERPTPPPIPQSDTNKDSTALGVLRNKSSRGSLFTKRDRSQDAPKASRSQAASPSRQRIRTGHEKSDKDEQVKHDERPVSTDTEGGEKEENVHAGLKAFRQARRELQKMKEQELNQRHAQAKHSNNQETSGAKRVGTREGGGPPPALFNRMPSEEFRNGGGSNAGSRPPSERDRSGSETSNNDRASSRGRRLRNGSASQDEHPGFNGVSVSPRPSPGLRSPSNPRQHYSRNANSPKPFSQPDFGQGTQPSAYRHGYESGQASPITPSTGGFVNNGAATTSFNHGEAPGKRVVNKRDISDPTFVSSTSRVPTVPLDGQHYGRTRNGSLLGAASSTPNLHAPTSAPPLPPINPRRKTGQSGTSRQSEEGPYLASPRVTAYQLSDDEGYAEQQRQGLRRMTSENNFGSRERSSPPRPANRPRLPPTTLSSNSMPGGMI